MTKERSPFLDKINNFHKPDIRLSQFTNATKWAFALARMGWETRHQIAQTKDFKIAMQNDLNEAYKISFFLMHVPDLLNDIFMLHPMNPRGGTTCYEILHHTRHWNLLYSTLRSVVEYDSAHTKKTDAAFALAQYHGYHYDTEELCPEPDLSNEKALYYYQIASAAGHPFATRLYHPLLLTQAKQHIDDTDFEAAAECLQQITPIGDTHCYAQAQTLLGEILYTQLPERLPEEPALEYIRRIKPELKALLPYLLQGQTFDDPTAKVLCHYALRSYFGLPFQHETSSEEEKEALKVKFIEELAKERMTEIQIEMDEAEKLKPVIRFWTR